MSLIFIFLSATNQAKVMTLEGTFDFHKNLVGRKGTKTNNLVKPTKKDFTENTPEEGTQVFVFGTNGDKCTWEREVINLSKSSISKSFRLQRKEKIPRRR